MLHKTNPLTTALAIAFVLNGCSRSLTQSDSDSWLVEESHEVSVVLDSTFNYRFVESVSLVGQDSESQAYIVYDTNLKRDRYVWNYIPTGNYDVVVRQALKDPIRWSIEVSSDTSLSLKSPFDQFKLVDHLSLKSLLNADTISFLYYSAGCWAHMIEKGQITRIDSNQYRLAHTDFYPKTPELKSRDFDSIGTSVIYDLERLIRDWKNEIEASKVRIEMIDPEDSSVVWVSTYMHSTVYVEFYILYENTLFRFTDSRGAGERKTYPAFKSTYFPNPPSLSEKELRERPPELEYDSIELNQGGLYLES